MKLIVGLGNPGKEYENTRHNVGFMVLDRFVDQFPEYFVDKQWKTKKRFESEIIEGKIDNNKIVVAKPQTFMNNSGRAVSKLMNFYDVEEEDVIVIYDDIATEFGSIRLRLKGSAGSHNGMESILHAVGTKDVKRIRVGIQGKYADSYNLREYVLQSFSKTEQSVLVNVLNNSTRALSVIMTETFEQAMNEFN